MSSCIYDVACAVILFFLRKWLFDVAGPRSLSIVVSMMYRPKITQNSCIYDVAGARSLSTVVSMMYRPKITQNKCIYDVAGPGSLSIVVSMMYQVQDHSV